MSPAGGTRNGWAAYAPAEIGPAQAAARGRAGGLRRAGLPRRGHGRHRRAGRGLQAGAVPALSRQTGALPRAAGHALRRDHRQDARPRCGTARDNKVRMAGAISAYFDFVDHESEAFRLVFESDLRNDPAVRERFERVERGCLEAITETIMADTGVGRERAELLAAGLCGAAEIAARFWLTGGRQVPKSEAEALVPPAVVARHRELPAAGRGTRGRLTCTRRRGISRRCGAESGEQCDACGAESGELRRRIVRGGQDRRAVRASRAGAGERADARATWSTP